MALKTISGGCDKPVRHLMCTSDGKDCVNEEIVFDKKQVVEAMHVPRSDQDKLVVISSRKSRNCLGNDSGTSTFCERKEG